MAAQYQYRGVNKKYHSVAIGYSSVDDNNVKFFNRIFIFGKYKPSPLIRTNIIKLLPVLMRASKNMFFLTATISNPFNEKKKDTKLF